MKKIKESILKLKYLSIAVVVFSFIVVLIGIVVDCLYINNFRFYCYGIVGVVVLFYIPFGIYLQQKIVCPVCNAKLKLKLPKNCPNCGEKLDN
ncbi:MAG: hypothetical protein A2015_17420 [Spirochaetes bacterium GWF1_31_7]|nr:MAG: hypothetical protein A2Y30_05410 [Spirochaetes bacterium GWE1_32_154]OHD46233.1 MAG: hypothetical protein A2Y29_08415 [Spirochaetes bacterium GWE2_31_10]OHD48603.1 MAG: hypothetical protein A2015_17420 [Spirochaetes bacterium GWF1_31_7]OHD81655.1 MAG: hypothetical protein A2355_03735 [Spirochaetes bacterium RIFOXYB1_FULL_32_8]HBD93050.1 hypothetical protein [Spirochaetia bacterium]